MNDVSLFHTTRRCIGFKRGVRRRATKAEVFDWGNEWVDATMSPPKVLEGVLMTLHGRMLVWLLVHLRTFRGRNLPRTGTTLHRGASRVCVAYIRQHKRPTPTRPTILAKDEEEELEQYSSTPNTEEDD